MRIDPDGIDLSWFAVDRDGHLAHFTSAGSRGVPAKVLASEPELNRISFFLRDLPSAGDAKLCPPIEGKTDFWLDMAKKGIFSYDFISEDDAVFEKGHYRLVALPKSPILLESLDPLVQKAFNSFRAPEICFKKVDRVTKEILTSIAAE